MRRYIPRDENYCHDLVVVGGGIYGAAMAYTATLNGLDVALFEQDDFANHTSANSQKVIHGGLRYLQSFDIKRVLESINEKYRFCSLFPHQVSPLPCLLPTSGYGTKGNEAFRVAFFLYSLLENFIGKRNANIKKAAPPQILSRSEVIQRFPHLKNENIRGGALWYDALCLEPERVILALLKSSVERGGQVANYMKVASFHRKDDSCFSIDLHDVLKKKSYSVCAKKIAICAGPWFKEQLGDDPVSSELLELSYIRGMNVIVPALFQSATSLATKMKNGKKSRFLFVVPWKRYSIEGTHWEDCDAPRDELQDCREKVLQFHALHQKSLRREPDQVLALASHVGIVPGLSGREKSAGERVLSQYRLVDAEVEGKGDVLQVVGVKFTTSFDVVHKALVQLFPDRNIRDTFCFDTLPSGSPTVSGERYLKYIQGKYAHLFNEKQCKILFQLLGTEIEQFAENYIQPHSTYGSPLSEDVLYKSLTRYCIENEMVYHLGDLVWRRIFPDNPELIAKEVCGILAEEMAKVLHWSDEQKQKEIVEIEERGKNI